LYADPRLPLPCPQEACLLLLPVAAAAGLFVEQDVSAFEQQMRVNFLGSVHSAKAALPGMLQRGSGRIVFVTSSLAILGFAGALREVVLVFWGGKGRLGCRIASRGQETC
jgi:hypothetical protein